MNQNQIRGKRGEQEAIKYLEKEGYKIIERNFECRQGEIDIIALKEDEIVFIEVKTRKSLECGFPSESVDRQKRKHIYKSAGYYLYSRNLENEYVRIDVIEVYEKDNKYEINHIKQAIDSYQ